MSPETEPPKFSASDMKKIRREHELAVARVRKVNRRLENVNFYIRLEETMIKDVERKIKLLEDESKNKEKECRQTETEDKTVTDKQIKCPICDLPYQGFTKSAPMILSCGHGLCRDCMHKTKEGMQEACNKWYLDHCPFDKLQTDFGNAIINKDVLQYNSDVKNSSQ